MQIVNQQSQDECYSKRHSSNTETTRKLLKKQINYQSIIPQKTIEQSRFQFMICKLLIKKVKTNIIVKDKIFNNNNKFNNRRMENGK